MAQIDITNTINIDLNGTPRGLSEFVVANTIIFSNEPAAFSDEFRAYVSPSDVAVDFGTDSVTNQMALKLFAVSPNLRSGRGTLYIVPYIAANATSGTVTTGDINTNIENFKEVTNGDLQIVIDGVQTKINKLNFSGVKTLQDVANVILAKNPDCYIDVVENTIKFTSKRFGTDSTINIEKYSGGSGVDVSGATLLNAQSLSPVNGINAVDTETLPEAIARVYEKISAGIVLDTCYRENASVIKNATSIEALELIYVEVTTSLKNMDILGKNIIEGGFTHSKLVAYSQGAVAAKGALAAYISYAVSPDWSGSNTAITMNLKELATVLPDNGLDQTYFGIAKANGVDIYGNTKGLACVYSFKNAGGYIDDQIGGLALQKALQIAGFNYLRQIKTKVPQTEQGMTDFKSVLANVWERYVRNGFIGKGLRWNTGSKFGDPQDFDRNIFEKGYYQYSLPVFEQSQADREDRIAPLVQAAGKSAGAIHSVNINGTIER